LRRFNEQSLLLILNKLRSFTGRIRCFKGELVLLMTSEFAPSQYYALGKIFNVNRGNNIPQEIEMNP